MSKLGEIKVLIVAPGQDPEVRVITNELESFKEIVGGYIECVPLPIGTELYYLVCNEEGKLKGLPPNRKVGYDTIVGTFLIAKSDGDEFGTLNDYEASAIARQFM